MLRFFVTASIFLIVGICQYGFKNLMKPVNPLKTELFVDLCSVVNMSLLIFDNSFKGFYIHGKSPYGQSEVSSEVLQQSLEYEALGKAQSRGLLKEEELQTFEVVLNQAMLERYKRYYQKYLNDDIRAQENHNEHMFNDLQKYGANKDSVPKNFDMDKMKNSHGFMNTMF